MGRLRRIVAGVGVGLAAVMLVAEVASADTLSDEASFVSRLNDLRTSKGLAPLAVDGQLAHVARDWSARMAGAGAISHNPSLAQQAPANWVRIGENVGTGGEVQAIHDAFVASRTHYANMVDGNFTEVGVGVVRAADGTIFVTVDFMKPGTPAPVATASAPPPPAKAPAVKVCRKTRSGKTVCRAARVRRR